MIFAMQNNIEQLQTAPRITLARRAVIAVAYAFVLVAYQSSGVLLYASIEGVSISDQAADIDWPVYDNPDLGEIKIISTFDPAIKGLWKAALGQPDVDTRRRALNAIGDAHQRGFQDMSDLASVIIPLLEQPQQHPVLLLAAARTLIQLDAKQAASILLQQNASGSKSVVVRGTAIIDVDPNGKRTRGTGGIEMVLLTDPALAKWSKAAKGESITSKALYAAWTQRLADDAFARPVRLSAIRSLGEVRHKAAVMALNTLIADDTNADLSMRLAAAKALALIETQDLEPLASSLASSNAKGPGAQMFFSKLLAATLLSHHDGDAAVKVLSELAVDRQTAVAGIAATRLLSIAPSKLSLLAKTLLVSRDPNIRLLVVRALATDASVTTIERISPLLDDHSPQVRQEVRGAFIRFAKTPELQAAVRKAVVTMLRDSKDQENRVNAWRGIEQAAIIAGRVDNEAVAPRLVELLKHPRNEVRSAAIVALRRLAVAETLPAILTHAESETKRWHVMMKLVTSDTTRPFQVNRVLDYQLAHLFQLLGEMKHMPAEPLLRQYIPKDSGFWMEARGAAVWALGMLHAGKPKADLVNAFASRLSDNNPTNPELMAVRRAAAISLGRMKDSGATARGALKKFLVMEKSSIHIGGACRWALIQIDGKQLPPLEPRHYSESGWFLMPLRK